MATVGELKIHVTTCGIPELEHLLAMLEANIENLPTIVVNAMLALADSVEKARCGAKIQSPMIDAALKDIARECHRASVAGGNR